MHFKVATFNVNSIRSRLQILMEWLEKQSPDVVCLQETKVVDKEFPGLVFESAGYRAAWFGQKAWNGVAILSKHPLEEVSRGLQAGGPADDARLIRASCCGVAIVNAYVPQGRAPSDPQFSYKMAWMKALRRLLSAEYSPKHRLLLCGDLNHAPESIDVYDPERLRGHVCYHPDINTVFRRLLPRKTSMEKINYGQHRSSDSHQHEEKEGPARQDIGKGIVDDVIQSAPTNEHEEQGREGNRFESNGSVHCGELYS